jgi:hypothetical protein
VKNDYIKKEGYLLILEALFNNPLINFDHHLHLIVEICAGFIMMRNPSDSQLDDSELVFKEKAADFLSRLINW